MIRHKEIVDNEMIYSLLWNTHNTIIICIKMIYMKRSPLINYPLMVTAHLFHYSKLPVFKPKSYVSTSNKTKPQ